MAVVASQVVGKVGLEGSEKTLSGLKNIGEATHKTSASFDMLKNAVSFAGGQVLFQGIGFLKDQLGGVFSESMNAQAGMAQTNQVLKSTHDISGMTAQGIGDLATQYSHLTQFSDDTVQSAENMLLTFTNIGKKVFPDATKTALDMSQALGQDVKSSAIQLGKALGDPLTGFSALQRVGVTFSDQQKASIKTFMAHNNTIAAQKVILAELSKEFGGSAVAAGKTFAGQWAIINQRLDDVRQNIGDALMPIVTQFVGYLSTQFVPRLNDFSDWFQKQGIPLIQQFGQWFENDGIRLTTQFGQTIYTVALNGAHFVQWLHDGTPPAQALTFAALALGGAIALIKIGEVVTDMKNFVTSAPEMIAKMFLVQESAEGIAGAKGFGAISTEAANADLAVAKAASGMKLSLAGIVGGVASVALLEMLAAKWIRDNNIVPTVKAAGGGKDNQPDWVTHHNPADDLKAAAQHAKDVDVQIKQAWKDMLSLYSDAEKRGELLGQLLDPRPIDAADLKVINLKSHLDDLAKPFILPPMTPITAEVEKARLKVIDLRAHLDDLKGPWVIEVGTRSVNAADLKVMKLKSGLDDSSGLPGHASGILNNPSGHWAMVGERGPEPMYVPQGASILPSGTLPGTANANSNQPVILMMDSMVVARGLMPAIVDQMRNNTAVRF